MSRTRAIAAAMAIAIGAGGALAAGAGNAAAAGPVVRSGMEIRTQDTVIIGAKCTLGAVLSPRRAVTAGHCGPLGDTVRDARGKVIGRIVTNQFTRRVDLAVIALAPGVRGVVDRVDYSGRYFRGQVVSKAGVRTGFTRGQVTNPRYRTVIEQGTSLRPPFLINQPIIAISTNLYSAEGDSGAGIRNANGAVTAILSGGVGGRTDVTPLSLLPANQR